MTSKEKDSTKAPKAKKSAKKEVRKGLADKTDTLASAGAPKDQRFKERWSALNSDVSNALGYWNDITEKYGGKVSKDQEQLQEIKCLLKELQKKIKVFND